MDIKPTGNKIVVKPDTPDNLAGDIIIPDVAQTKPQKGEVVAIGSSKDIEVKVGDKILYGRNTGVNYKGFIIMREFDVLSTIKQL